NPRSRKRKQWPSNSARVPRGGYTIRAMISKMIRRHLRRRIMLFALERFDVGRDRNSRRDVRKIDPVRTVAGCRVPQLLSGSVKHEFIPCTARPGARDGFIS